MTTNNCTIQPPRHTKLEHSEKIRQNGNRIKDISEHSKQTHNQEIFAMRRSGWISRKPDRSKTQDHQISITWLNKSHVLQYYKKQDVVI